VSHSKERKEKICLNCRADLVGRFCHICGQENLEPKETVWQLVTHFLNDITHFDGSFFNTTKFLIQKPGFLSREYITGKRARYLHPIRMYVFTSAFFFLVFFTLFRFNEFNLNPKGPRIKYIQQAKAAALKDARTKTDSSAIEEAFGYAERGTIATIPLVADSLKNGFRTGITFSKNYKSKTEYDSVQQHLPSKDRDGWFSRLINLKSIELKDKYAGDINRLAGDLVDHLMHTFPYLLFVTLPLYGLILKLLYIRRKQFFYVDHGIFLTHLYIFTFLLLLVYFSLIKINERIGSGWIRFIEFALIIYGIYYAFRAMYIFYGQGKGKTFLKFMILNFFAFFCILFLFTFFFIISVFQI
jgi:hypothetical protein